MNEEAKAIIKEEIEKLRDQWRPDQDDTMTILIRDAKKAVQDALDLFSNRLEARLATNEEKEKA